jgi:tetratricopeptide (TPR) repeat protein
MLDTPRQQIGWLTGTKIQYAHQMAFTNFSSDHASMIREARLRAKLPLEALAEGVCSTSYLSLVERGKRVPSVRVLDLVMSKLEALGSYVDFFDTTRFLAALAALNGGDFLLARKLSIELGETGEALISALTAEAQGKFVNALGYLDSFYHRHALPPKVLLEVHLCGLRCKRAIGDVYGAAVLGEKLIERLSEESNSVEVELLEAKATLSSVYLELGDLSRASTLVSDLPDRPASLDEAVQSLWAKGLVAYESGRYEYADACLSAAASVASQLGQLTTRARLMQTAVWLRIEHGNEFSEEDRAAMAWAISHFESNQNTFDLALTLNTMALAEASTLHKERALELVERSVKLANSLDAYSRARILQLSGKVALDANSPEVANKHLLDAMVTLKSCKESRLHSRIWSELAASFESQGAVEEALFCYRQALQTSGLLHPVLESQLVATDADN